MAYSMRALVSQVKSYSACIHGARRKRITVAPKSLVIHSIPLPISLGGPSECVLLHGLGLPSFTSDAP